jgi:hypothetical protein
MGKKHREHKSTTTSEAPETAPPVSSSEESIAITAEPAAPPSEIASIV